jgi:hypothetical protein
MTLMGLPPGGPVGRGFALIFVAMIDTWIPHLVDSTTTAEVCDATMLKRITMAWAIKKT